MLGSSTRSSLFRYSVHYARDQREAEKVEESARSSTLVARPYGLMLEPLGRTDGRDDRRLWTSGKAPFAFMRSPSCDSQLR